MTESPRPPGCNVGALRQSGVTLSPREVVALVHALSNMDGPIPSADEGWITNAGEAIVVARGRTAAADPALKLAGLAALMDALLPPFREDRRYAPPASLHMIPGRL